MSLYWIFVSSLLFLVDCFCSCSGEDEPRRGEWRQAALQGRGCRRPSKDGAAPLAVACAGAWARLAATSSFCRASGPVCIAVVCHEQSRQAGAGDSTAELASFSLFNSLDACGFLQHATSNLQQLLGCALVCFLIGFAGTQGRACVLLRPAAVASSAWRTVRHRCRQGVCENLNSAFLLARVGVL